MSHSSSVKAVGLSKRMLSVMLEAREGAMEDGLDDRSPRYLRAAPRAMRL